MTSRSTLTVCKQSYAERQRWASLWCAWHLWLWDIHGELFTSSWNINWYEFIHVVVAIIGLLAHDYMKLQVTSVCYLIIICISQSHKLRPLSLRFNVSLQDWDVLFNTLCIAWNYGLLRKALIWNCKTTKKIQRATTSPMESIICTKHSTVTLSKLDCYGSFGVAS